MLKSRTLLPGCEQYEHFIQRGKGLVQYDYRAVDGELFSCVKPRLAQCREAMVDWRLKRHTKSTGGVL